MINKDITYLLNRYMENTISGKELNELKIFLQITDDDELSLYLSQLWRNYEPKEKPDMLALDKVYRNIRKENRRQTVRKNIRLFFKAAAILLIPLLSIFSIHLYTILNNNAETDNDRRINIIVDKGQQASVILADGTLVKLNSESQLSYKNSYAKKGRFVNFTGEAYFSVVKDSVLPFIVQTEHLEIEVLGTTFNVYSYEEEVMEMTLISGHIKVTTHSVPVKTVFLHPREKALYSKSTGELTVEKTDSRFETAWLRGDIVFRSRPMEEVLRKLERKYGVNIHLEDSLMKQDIFTGSFNADNIHEVMKILQTHYIFTYSVSGDDVFIKPY